MAVDDRTANFHFQEPSSLNLLQDDVIRLRAALESIDTLLAGRASLGADGKLLLSQLPAIAVTEYLGSVASQLSMLQLVGQKGDWCIRTDQSKVWVVTGGNPASIDSWTAMAYPGGGVSSVNSRTGVVVLDKSDLGLGNIDNTSDLSKPLSTAAIAALAAKQATITGAASSIVDTLLTAGRVVISDGYGKVNVSTVTADILSRIGDLTSSAQAQLDLRVAKTTATGSAGLPVGTTAQRDIAPVVGAIRFNSTAGNFEGYYGVTPGWKSIGAAIAIANITDWPAAVDATEVGYLDGVTGALQGQLNGLSSSIASINSALSGKQPIDSDLTAIAALSGSYGYLKKTAEGVWTIDAGAGGGSGTVTAVALSAPSPFTVAGSPITASGTLALGVSNQNANSFYAGPASGSAASPSFRSLVVGDIPSLSSLYQAVDSDLTAIAALSNYTGVLQRNNGVWSLSTTIGGAQPGPAYFTTLQASGTVQGQGFITLFASPPAIGTGTPATGAFANLSYSGSLTGSTGILNIGNYQLYKDSSGRVGLGLAPSDWGTKALELYAAGNALYSGAAASIGIASGCYYNNGWKRANSSTKAAILECANGGVYTSTVNSIGSAGSAITFADGPYLAPGSNSWTNGSSDERLKKNFGSVPGLDALMSINPISYLFGWESDGSTRRLGFSAQNLRPLVPEMVVEKRERASDGTPILTIIPDYLLPVLVQAVQELATRVHSLEEASGPTPRLH